VDSSDADDEGSSSEAKEPAIKDSSSQAKEPAVDLYDEGPSSKKAADDLSDEWSSSEESAVEVFDEGGSSSEESDNNPSQQHHTTLQTPPLDFPASPAPHEAVFANGFNMEGNDQQSDSITSWYATEKEVCSLPFNVLD